MAAKNEMSITIRAVDAATAVIAKVKRGFLDFGKGAVTAALKVSGAVVGILNPLKLLKIGMAGLLGGGILGAVTNKFGGLANELARNAKQYEAAFSPEQQRRIDDVASAFNRFGASIKATFGNILATHADAIERALNGVSDWFRDHADDIVNSLGSFATRIGWIVDHLKAAKQWAGEAFDAVDKLVSSQNKVNLGGSFAGNGSSLGSDENPDDFIFRTTRPLQWKAQQDALNKTESYWKGIGEAITGAAAAAGKYAAALTPKDQAAMASATKAATVEIVRQRTSIDDQARSLATFEAALKAATEAYDRFQAKLDQIADTITDHFLDALEALVDGTKSVAQAFKEMTLSILKDIARLLLRDEILKFVRGLVGSIAGGFAPPAPGSSTLAGVSSHAYVGVAPPAVSSPASAPQYQTIAPTINVHINAAGSGLSTQALTTAVQAGVSRGLAQSRSFRRNVRMA